MNYVISDLHGYPLERFKKLLCKANFNHNDRLYILGDVLDNNGDGGIEFLRWIMTQDNIELILGNHEDAFLKHRFIVEKDQKDFTLKQKYEYSYFIYEKNSMTFESMKKLTKKQRSEIYDYLKKAPIYRSLKINNQKYNLVHSGYDEFDKSKKIYDYKRQDLLLAWPEIADVYYDDVITIFGHTPTFTYNNDFCGKIIKTATWIDIDMGYGVNKIEPVLLRLEDMAEFRNI